MKTKNISSYKTESDRQFIEKWIEKIQTLNQSFYKRLSIETAFGKTIIFSFNDERKDLEPIIFLPGARLCAMSWDLNDNLKILKSDFRFYLIDVIGQPGLSSGNSPDVKTDEFGKWLVEVLDGLKLEKTDVVGASFGGELAMKLANVAPERIKKMVLMNPVGLSYISLAPRVTFYNLLPILFPNERNVNRFIDNVAFAAPNDLSPKRRELLGEFILQTLTRFNFKADYPYKMPDAELDRFDVSTYVILGDADQLIPHRKIIERANRLLKNLKDIRVLNNIGHGIELSKKAIEILRDILKTSV